MFLLGANRTTHLDGAPLRTSNSGVQAIAALLVVPFGLYHALFGRAALGVMAIFFVGLLLLNGWQTRHARRGRMLTSYGLLLSLTLLVALATVTQHEFGVLWCFPALLAIYCLLPERQALVGNLLLLGVELVVISRVIEPAFASRAYATLVFTSIIAAILVRAIVSQRNALQRTLITDKLTGCLNRVTLHDALTACAEQARTQDEPAALLAIDIDHFKRVNDQLGHARGDTVLDALGTVFRAHLQRREQVFRLGGEEFLWLLPGADERTATQRAETLRLQVIEARPLDDRVVTVSIGVAVLAADESWRQWARRADQALYAAKDDGRDRFMLAA